MNIGDTVTLRKWQHGMKARKDTQVRDTGEVIYISPFGWATVRMVNRYNESFWLDELTRVEDVKYERQYS